MSLALPPMLELLVTIKVASMSGVFCTSSENWHASCNQLIDEGLVEEIFGLTSGADKCYKLTEAGAKKVSGFHIVDETND